MFVCVQGLVLDCSPLQFTPLDKLPPAAGVVQAAVEAGVPCPVWVALDEVLDPVSCCVCLCMHVRVFTCERSVVNVNERIIDLCICVSHTMTSAEGNSCLPRYSNRHQNTTRPSLGPAFTLYSKVLSQA